MALEIRAKVNVFWHVSFQKLRQFKTRLLPCPGANRQQDGLGVKVFNAERIEDAQARPFWHRLGAATVGQVSGLFTMVLRQK